MTNRELAQSIKRTMKEFSVEKIPDDRRKNTMVKVIDGYRLLGTPVRSEESTEKFSLQAAAATKEDAMMLEKAFQELQTILC